MNKKGFTLIELIVAFGLAAVIIIVLFNVLLIIKINYEETSVRTKLYINQSTLSNVMNSKLNYGNIVSYSECPGSFCYKFKLSNMEEIELSVTEDKIKFGTYVYKLASGDKVVNPSLDLDLPYLVIKIPIVSKTYPNEDFGINLVYKRG